MAEYSPPRSRRRAAASSYRTPRNTHAHTLISSDKDTSPEGPSTPPSRPSQPGYASDNSVLEELLLISSATYMVQEDETDAGRGAGLGTAVTPRQRPSKGNMTPAKRIQSPDNTSPRVSRVIRSPVGLKKTSKTQYLGDKLPKPTVKQTSSIRHSYSASSLKDRPSASPSRRLHGAISSQDLNQDPHSRSKGRHSSAIDELKDSVQFELSAFRRTLREEASKELADFRQALARDAYKEANALSTRLKNVEAELETTKTQLDEARSETAAVKLEFHAYREQHRTALKNYTKLIRTEITELGLSVSAILNRDALEKESDCVEAYAKFMWNTLRDAIPQTPELLSGASELDHPDQSCLSPQPATAHDGDRHGVFDSSYDDDAMWVRSTRKDTGHWAVPPEYHVAYLKAKARIVTAVLPIDARTRVSTRARDDRLHHDRHRVHLNNLNTERPLLFDHLAKMGAMNLFYHDIHTQHRLTDLGDPITPYS